MWGLEISLTLFWHLSNPRSPYLRMNSIRIFRQGSKMFLMHWHGGTNGVPFIHDLHAWQSIIWLSQVCLHNIFFHVNLFLLVATSVDVERLFSRGHVLLSHNCNRLSSQTTRALLCLGDWSHLGLVNSDNVHKVSLLDDVAPMDGSSEPTEVELPDGWDAIDA